MHRPAFLVAPAPVLKVGAGHLAPEVLGSMNVVPAALEAAGYRFTDRDIDAVLAAGLA